MKGREGGGVWDGRCDAGVVVSVITFYRQMGLSVSCRVLIKGVDEVDSAPAIRCLIEIFK